MEMTIINILENLDSEFVEDIKNGNNIYQKMVQTFSIYLLKGIDIQERPKNDLYRKVNGNEDENNTRNDIRLQKEINEEAVDYENKDIENVKEENKSEINHGIKKENKEK